METFKVLTAQVGVLSVNQLAQTNSDRDLMTRSGRT